MKFSAAALTMLQVSNANWLYSSPSKPYFTCFLAAYLFGSVSGKNQLTNDETVSNDTPPGNLLRGVNQKESTGTSLSHDANIDTDLNNVDVPEKYGEMVEFASHLLSKPVAQLTIEEQKDLLIEIQGFFKDTLLVEFNSTKEEMSKVPGLEQLARSVKHIKLDHFEEACAEVINILQDALAVKEEEVLSTTDEKSISVTRKTLPRNRRRRTKEFDKGAKYDHGDMPRRTSLKDQQEWSRAFQKKHGNRGKHMQDRMLSFGTWDNYNPIDTPEMVENFNPFDTPETVDNFNPYGTPETVDFFNPDDTPETVENFNPQRLACDTLVKCVLGMSMYDMFVYFYSDDINVQNGDVDTNVVRFDEKDLVTKHEEVLELARLAKTETEKCSALLQQFHRTIERGQISEWEGATVGQVCLAEGTTVFVKVDAMMDALLVDVVEDQLLVEQEKIAEKMIGETFRCAEELFYLHDDQKDYVRDEEFVFEGCGKDYDGVCPLSSYKFPTSVDVSSDKEIHEDADTFYIQSNDEDDKWLSAHESSNFGLDFTDKSDSKRKFGWILQRDVHQPGISSRCIMYGEEYWVRLAGFGSFDDPHGLRIIGSSSNAHESLILDSLSFMKFIPLSKEYDAARSDPKSGQCVKYDDLVMLKSSISGFLWTGPGSGPHLVSLEASDRENFLFILTEHLGDGSRDMTLRRDKYGQLTGSNGDYSFKKYDDLIFDYETCVAKVQTGKDRSEWQEEYRKCIAEKINKELGKSLQLVFGSNPSPGFICGVKDSVKNGKSLPGYCCLDAPFQLAGSNWGHEFTCDMQCQRYGPYFAGISEASCHAQGGTFCPNPADCSTLQTCVNKFKHEAEATNNTMFKTYLLSAPSIKDPTNHEQCGMTRGYFGFDQNFIYDRAICEDIEQLKHSKSFSFAFEFFSDSKGTKEETDVQGVGVSNDCTSIGDLKPEPPVDADTKQVKAFVLSEVNRDLSSEEPAKGFSYLQDGVFVAQEVCDTFKDASELIVSYACPEDITGTVKTICAQAKNIAWVIAHLLYITARMVANVGMHFFEKYGYPDGGKEFETYENTQAVYGHMVDTGKYMENSLNIVLSDIALVKKGINSITGPTAQNIVKKVDEMANRDRNMIMDTLNNVLSEIEKIRETSNGSQPADRHLNMNMLPASLQVTPENHLSNSKESAPPLEDKIKLIDERIASVDEKMAILGQEVAASVDENMALMDEKIATMGQEISAAMDEKIASLKDDILKSILDMKREN